jgi:hypothetical protein
MAELARQERPQLEWPLLDASWSDMWACKGLAGVQALVLLLHLLTLSTPQASEHIAAIAGVSALGLLNLSL